ncbi:MAG: hypothetical protein PF570_07200, partial [Candidatus Cloacimonetes bacterium]|nr:hypothetical protein [Candidatus Cloacimonadota bacterium]
MKKRDKNIIDKIRNKLLKQEMSVLVGSGFSKNANTNFPLWGALLLDLLKDLFKPEYEKWKKDNPKKDDNEFIKLKSHEYDYLD